MSTNQVEATALLCRLLELLELTVNGKALHEGEWVAAAKPLLAAHLLTHDVKLPSVTCYECWVELARVVKELPNDQVRLLCPECGEVDAPAYVCQTYRLAPARLILKLLVGLDFSLTAMKAIDKDTPRADLLWRLGTSVPKRGKGVTWYFGRHLHQPEVAQRLREQIAADHATQSAIVLTSSEVPLPPGSLLTGFDVRSLFMVGQIEAHSFTFFADRFDAPGPQLLEEAQPGTTLRYVKTKRLVFLDGESIQLEPRQQKLLMALIDDLDHELDNAALRDKVGSVAENFSPSKVFDRIPKVYRAFIRYGREDERYGLIIPEEDCDWLI